MKCPNCGTKVDHDDFFCPECGGELREYVKEEKKTSEQKRLLKEYAVEQRKSPGECKITRFATASLVLGILGLIFFFIPLLSILAIIFGIIALVKIGRNENLSGRGRAIAGMLLGIIKWVAIFIVIKNFSRIFGSILPTILGIKL